MPRLARLAAGLIAIGAWAIILWLDMAERQRLWLLVAFTVAGLFGVNYVINLTPRRPYPPLQGRGRAARPRRRRWQRARPGPQ